MFKLHSGHQLIKTWVIDKCHQRIRLDIASFGSHSVNNLFVSRFSDFISLDKKKHGNRDVRIVYKPKNDNMIPNRMGTYIRS